MRAFSGRMSAHMCTLDDHVCGQVRWRQRYCHSTCCVLEALLSRDTLLILKTNCATLLHSMPCPAVRNHSSTRTQPGQP